MLFIISTSDSDRGVEEANILNTLSFTTDGKVTYFLQNKHPQAQEGLLAALLDCKGIATTDEKLLDTIKTQFIKQIGL